MLNLASLLRATHSTPVTMATTRLTSSTSSISTNTRELDPAPPADPESPRFSGLVLSGEERQAGGSLARYLPGGKKELLPEMAGKHEHFVSVAGTEPEPPRKPNRASDFVSKGVAEITVEESAIATATAAASTASTVAHASSSASPEEVPERLRGSPVSRANAIRISHSPLSSERVGVGGKPLVEDSSTSSTTTNSSSSNSSSGWERLQEVTEARVLALVTRCVWSF
jgi:hypothetical protein